MAAKAFLTAYHSAEAPPTLKLNAFLCCYMPTMAQNCYVNELFYGH